MANDRITFLPGEILEYVLENERLQFADIVRFSLTCKQLEKLISNNNKLWKIKFFQRWPHLKDMYHIAGTLNNSEINWKEEAQVSCTVRRKLMELLDSMSAKHYETVELRDTEFQEYDSLVNANEGGHPSAYFFLTDELVNLIECPPEQSNLTHQYYAYTVVRHLKHNHLKEVWQKFLNLPQRKQILEYGASIVAEWNLPEERVSYSQVSWSLDVIANLVKDQVREECPEHPIFSCPPEKFVYWQKNNIDDNEWSVPETRKVIDAICTVLFDKLEFQNVNDLSEHSLINYVLRHKRGIPMLIGIIFAAVARRLGVRCDAIVFPFHFLIRWKESYASLVTGGLDDYYIDVLAKGRLLTKKDCPLVGDAPKCPVEKWNILKPGDATEVVKRIADSTVYIAKQHTRLNGRRPKLRSALELQHMLEPKDSSFLLHLAHFYVVNHMYPANFISKLEELCKEGDGIMNDEAYQNAQHLQVTLLRPLRNTNRWRKKRPRGLRYGIGLIMIHTGTGVMGVISGWHSNRRGLPDGFNRPEDEFSCFVNQPWYQLLMDNGTCWNIAQEFLSEAPVPKLVDNYEIGRYFSKFCGTHYVPNEQKAWEYPQDEEFVKNWFAPP